MSNLTVQARPAVSILPTQQPALAGPALPARPGDVRTTARPEQPELTRLAQVSSALPAELQITPEEKAAYDAHNALMMKRYAKYPELIPLLKDPDTFLQGMQARFEAQKAITPSDPYQFDMSDYGIPVLKDVHAALLRKSDKLAQEATEHASSWHIFGGARKADEYKVGQEFLQALSKEVGTLVDSGKVSYRRLQELAYFGTNAMGYFDKLTLKQRAMLQIDRTVVEGHEDVSIQDLYHDYQRNSGFSAFQKTSMNPAVEKHRGPFEHAMFNKEKLEYLTLPSMRPMGKSLFMRFLPYPIYFAGIGENPIPADGFMRPGGDFYLHDMRHNSSIFGEMQEYIARHQLSEPQVNKLRKSMDLWQWQLNEAQGQIGDKQLKEAVGLKTFSHHHDSGNVYLPSLYLEGRGPSTMVLYFTYFMKEMAGQANGFSHPVANLGRANDFLQGFWQSRYPTERAIINARPQ